jgi:spermidine synthase
VFSGLPARFRPPVAAALALGVTSQLGQVLFLRELLMVFHGNELAIGIVLAAWLVWVGIGSLLGPRLLRHSASWGRWILGTAAALSLLLPGTILIIRNLRAFFDVLPGAYLSVLDMAVASFLVMAPACLLLGVQFLLVSRAWRESDLAEDTSGASKAYVGEAAGNMLGGVVFTFFMVRHLNALQSAAVAGVVMLMAGCWQAVRTGRPVPAAFWGALLLASLAFPGLATVDRWAYRAQWTHQAPDHQLVATYQSRHGTIAVLRREDQYTFFQSGHLLFSAAGPGTLAPGLEELEAGMFAHLAMAQHLSPGRVLLLGGGLRGMLAEVLAHPVERVDYVELDEALTRAALPYLSPRTREALADARVRLIHTDGRLWVKTTPERYDLIILDAPDPVTAALNRYYTLEFFRQAQDRLRPGGVLVLSTASTPDLRDAAVANRNATIYHTLSRVFPRVLVAGDRVMFYVASGAYSAISADPSVLARRHRERGVQAAHFSPYQFYALLQPHQTARLNWVVRNHGRAPDAHLVGPPPVPLSPGPWYLQELAEDLLPPVTSRHFINSDWRPIAYYYSLMFWEELTRAGRGRTLARLLPIQAWWFLPGAALPVLVGLVLGRTRQLRRQLGFSILFAAGATGFSTMALQIALIFSFQSVYGFVYELVGLIVALFMGGLALGAFLTHRRLVPRAGTGLLARFQLVAALWAGATALLLPASAAVGSPDAVFFLFSALTIVSGMVNGVNFPLSAACYRSLTPGSEATAASVYSAELFGAFLGAVLSSAVVAPVLGILYCCLLAVFANVTGFLVLRLPGQVPPGTAPDLPG